MVELLVLCERDDGRQRADQPASVELVTVEQVDGALKLRHVDLVAFPVAPVEPREFIFAVAQELHSEQVVAERALVVQEVLVVGRMLYLRVRVDWTVAHELVLDDLELANQLNEQRGASLASVVIRKRVIDDIGAVREEFVLFILVK